jgi:hypothetical protein
MRAYFLRLDLFSLLSGPPSRREARVLQRYDLVVNSSLAKEQWFGPVEFFMTSASSSMRYRPGSDRCHFRYGRRRAWHLSERLVATSASSLAVVDDGLEKFADIERAPRK